MNSSLLKLGPEAGQPFWKIDDLFQVSVDTVDTFSKWSNLVSELRQSQCVTPCVSLLLVAFLLYHGKTHMRTSSSVHLSSAGKIPEATLRELRVGPTAHRADALEL